MLSTMNRPRLNGVELDNDVLSEVDVEGVTRVTPSRVIDVAGGASMSTIHPPLMVLLSSIIVCVGLSKLALPCGSRKLQKEWSGGWMARDQNISGEIKLLLCLQSLEVF